MCIFKSKNCEGCNGISCSSTESNTLVPASAAWRTVKAEGFLQQFGQHVAYEHRGRNRHLTWLKSYPTLPPDALFRFFCFWAPVSFHQPQILLKIAGAYSDWKDRRLIMLNYLEEEGMTKEGHHPHHVLLQHLLAKLGGRMDPDPEADELISAFHRSIVGMSAAQATGYLAGIEHVALDVSDFFTVIVRNAGRAELLTSDPYLAIHVDVEPKHIIWSHGNALDWMQDKAKQERDGYTAEEVLDAFKHAMNFWDDFWGKAFRKLGYLA
jgi:Iron-containing redox enzyme